MRGDPDHARAVLAIDAGGTTCSAAAVRIDPLPPSDDALAALHTIASNPEGRPLTTVAEVTAYFDRLGALLATVARGARDEGVTLLPLVGFGHPGKHGPGIGERIAPGTHPHLGPAFDNVAPAAALEAALTRAGLPAKVFCRNDGLAQMLHALTELSRDAHFAAQIDGRRVGYVGIGSGLAGGFGRVTLQAPGRVRVDFVTDGHIGDLVIDGWQAERDRISGLLLEQRAGVSAAIVAQQLDRYRPILEEMGRNLGAIIAALHTGEFTKARPSTRWSAADRAAVRGTRVFIVGGRAGSDGVIGEVLRHQARRLLALRGLPVALYGLPAASRLSGVLGAALFVPPEAIRSALRAEGPS